MWHGEASTGLNDPGGVSSSPALAGFSEEVLYRAVLDSFPDVTVFVFGPDRRYAFLAGGAVQERGWKTDEIVGRTPRELIGAAGEELEDAMEAALAGEVRHIEVSGLRRSEVVWASTVGPLFDVEGSVIGGIVVSRDVGAIRQAEAQQRSMEAAAVASARLAEFERRQRERLEFLSEINDVIADCTDRLAVMRAVTRAAVPRLGDWCTIYVFLDPHERDPVIEIAHVDPALEAYARELHDRFPYDPEAPLGVASVIRSGRPALMPLIDEELMERQNVPDETRQVVRWLGLRSVIIVPLTKRHQVIGALEFFTSADEQYGPNDLALAQAVAGRVASALDNHRLAERQREIARTLQQSLLPDRLPEVPGTEVAVRYWAAGEGAEVGGDFYDLFAVDDKTHAVVIGDVCGSGPEAAAVTALARHTIRAAAWRGDDPAEVLASLNTAMLRTRPGTFCTVAYATLRPAEREVRYAIAVGGHPLPLRVAGDGSVAPVGQPGMLVGAFESGDRAVVTGQIAPGEALVLYTDGACDLPPPDGLDDREMAELVGSSVRGAEDAETAAERISEALTRRRPFHERDDDVALVVIRAVEGEPKGLPA